MSVVVDRGTLTRDLVALGLPRGALVMVHASLRRVGPIDGGAGALLDALCDVLGPEGTMMMALGATDDRPFDKLSSPIESDLGVLAEVFRTQPGTLVSDHAAARFGARGALASIVEPVPLHDYYGPGSALERFTAHGGMVLRLGANLDTVTLTHYAEYLADLPDKTRVSRRYVRADTGEQVITCIDDCDGIGAGLPDDYFPQVLVDFLASGGARVSPVGNCTAELFTARAFVPFAVAWMEHHGRRRP